MICSLFLKFKNTTSLTADMHFSSIFSCQVYFFFRSHLFNLGNCSLLLHLLFHFFHLIDDQLTMPYLQSTDFLVKLENQMVTAWNSKERTDTLL